MGRFESLNDETKDLVECILPPLASSFKVSDAVYIIPEDIRMRQWDVQRRDHIKDKTENDPRNWGVQFLKDLKAIARLTGGDLDKFQMDLREKVALHQDKHPWARLADIKDIRLDYENPGRKERMINPIQASSDDSSTDSYLEELVEPDHSRGSKRKAGCQEVYEARVQESTKRRKNARLRRADGGGFIRKEKTSKKRPSIDRGTPRSSNQSRHRTPTHQAARRNPRIIDSDGEEFPSSLGDLTTYSRRVSNSMSPSHSRAQPDYMKAVDASNEPLDVQRLAAELDVAEAELKTARLKYQYIQAREEAEKKAHGGSLGV